MKNIAKKIYIALIVLFLYAPIGTLMVLSFNASKTRAKWGGITFKWYGQLLHNDDILKAFGNTLLIALLSSVIATIIGTIACIAMSNMKKRTRMVMLGITNIPMLNADIVTGISLMLLFISFGFKFGIPMESDLVFDVRCLPNPFYDEALRPQTGLDAAVRDYVMEKEETIGFVSRFTDMVDYLLPLYSKEGKSQLVIAVGCTGGHHRSVALAQYMCDYLGEKGIKTSVTHRDIQKF